MGNEAPVTAEFDVATMRVERRVHLVTPEPATPAVVVASDHGESYAASPESCQPRKSGERHAGNDRLVLKPELKQVTAYDKMVSQFGHRIEKPVESGR